MKKYFSLILAIAITLFFVGLIAKNEWHLDHSKSILLSLSQLIRVQFYKVTIWHWLMS